MKRHLTIYSIDNPLSYPYASEKNVFYCSGAYHIYNHRMVYGNTIRDSAVRAISSFTKKYAKHTDTKPRHHDARASG